MSMSDERKRSQESAAIALFDDETAEKTIRRVWHDNRWFFSVIDEVDVLTDSANPSEYWRVLESRLKDEGGDEVATKCNGLKMTAAEPGEVEE